MNDHDGQNRSRKRHFGYEAGMAIVGILLASLVGLIIVMMTA